MPALKMSPANGSYSDCKMEGVDRETFRRKRVSGSKSWGNSAPDSSTSNCWIGMESDSHSRPGLPGATRSGPILRR
jgi:hypothetical protein